MRCAAGRIFDDVSSAILGDPLGRSAAGVIALYETYGARAPGVGELDYWRAQLTGGVTLTQVRAAILADALGRDHTAEVIGGRAPITAAVRRPRAKCRPGRGWWRAG